MANNTTAEGIMWGTSSGLSQEVKTAKAHISGSKMETAMYRDLRLV